MVVPSVLDFITRVRIASIALTTVGLIGKLDTPLEIPLDKPLLREYDFIVVGAGSGGSVVAGRLAEEHLHHVLLLEAGDDGTHLSSISMFNPMLYDTEFDWKYRPVPEPGYCLAFRGENCKQIRGKMLGGSSAINAGMYVRGNRRDFDHWEALGNPGWGYRHLLPYFIRSEDNRDLSLTDSKYHGRGGPMPISYGGFYSDLAQVWLEAGRYLGYPIVDHNAAEQYGFTRPQLTMRDGKRWSTARAFLEPIAGQANLHVQVRSQVTRLLLTPDGSRVYGVEFMKAGQYYKVRARKEVILSAGAFNSPQLLMLSGIGPCDHLQKHRIKCRHNLPGVGKNMQSHPGIADMDFLTNHGHGINIEESFNPMNLPNYFIKGRGILTSVLIEGMAFIDSGVNNNTWSSGWPDIQLQFYPYQISADGGALFRNYLGIKDELWREKSPYSFRDGFQVQPILLRPYSRGSVRLHSSNPYDQPEIRLNLLSDHRDVAAITAGGRLARKVALSDPFRRVGARTMPSDLPPCRHLKRFSDYWWECRIRQYTSCIYHETSTCQMGPAYNPQAVVDNQLRVHGVSGLRVADASVMPTIVSGNTNAAIIMIGERAADLIRSYWHAVKHGMDPELYVTDNILLANDY